ncbi:hypothetical protein, partial [Stenotrophomonas acidaminiphila]|uniref:hypothetical protein n=1 Tax=Stenotrophomonas acidaminiphila TaxID=128780 RepID=UPI0028B061A8
MSTNKIIVRSVSELGRWRAGRKFTRAGETLNVASLSKEDLDAIKRDPLLRVIDVPESDGERAAREAAEQAAAEQAAAEQAAAEQAAAEQAAAEQAAAEQAA